ncbi:unnamed protein product [Soboliphyme baturini]|uniref:Cytochrome c domain-containing protein n=1 Tax=Soboliphyme baturini TaxID=241478 RepID=A0A183ID23_9BILA|nr:unnamed protein product [Soboliphyme baturini]
MGKFAQLIVDCLVSCRFFQLLYVVGLTTAGGVGLFYALEKTVSASGFLAVPIPHLPWFHSGLFHGYDSASLRRGYQVYKQVCCACHSMKQLRYRHFIDVFLTADEAKDEAAEIRVQDGPNDQGQMFMRPGTVNDYLPSPYPNEVVGRNANHGLYPPDLSLITLARHRGEDYIFMLLTGYTEAPAGIHLESDQHYNPYFPSGGAIGMAPALFDEMIEYSDGTPASVSQMAKDVCSFLKFCSEPELNDRKRYAIKVSFLRIVFSELLLYSRAFVSICLSVQFWSSI